MNSKDEMSAVRATRHGQARIHQSVPLDVEKIFVVHEQSCERCTGSTPHALISQSLQPFVPQCLKSRNRIERASKFAEFWSYVVLP